MPEATQTSHQSIEHTSTDGEEEEKEEIGYDIEWKVIIDKEPILGDLIRRSDFRFGLAYRNCVASVLVSPASSERLCESCRTKP